MTAPLKKYLVEAIWNWCTDAGLTPYLAVAVDASCAVPEAYVRDGQIVFDISDEAVRGLTFADDGVGFQARFGEDAMQCFAPYPNIVGAFPEEDPSQGIFFGFEKAVNPAPDAPETPAKPSFSRVK